MAAAAVAQKRKRVATEKWSAHLGTLKARVAAVEAKRARRASLEAIRDAGVRPDMGIADPAACPLDPSNPSMARVRSSHRPTHLVRTPLQCLQYMHHQCANSPRTCATQCVYATCPQCPFDAIRRINWGLLHALHHVLKPWYLLEAPQPRAYTSMVSAGGF